MKSIFIAEGNQSVATLFAAVFARESWKVSTYSDGPRAADALRGPDRFDVVLVSYDVPGTNGVELTRILRALAHRRDTPVVMVTASGGIEAQAFSAGVNEVLRKPIDIHALVAAVSKYVVGPASRSQSSG